MCDLMTAKYYQNRASIRGDHLIILACENDDYILASEDDLVKHPELTELQEIR